MITDKESKLLVLPEQAIRALAVWLTIGDFSRLKRPGLNITAANIITPDIPSSENTTLLKFKESIFSNGPWIKLDDTCDCGQFVKSCPNTIYSKIFSIEENPMLPLSLGRAQSRDIDFVVENLLPYTPEPIPGKKHPIFMPSYQQLLNNTHPVIVQKNTEQSTSILLTHEKETYRINKIVVRYNSINDIKIYEILRLIPNAGFELKCIATDSEDIALNLFYKSIILPFFCMISSIAQTWIESSRWHTMGREKEGKEILLRASYLLSNRTFTINDFNLSGTQGHELDILKFASHAIFDSSNPSIYELYEIFLNKGDKKTESINASAKSDWPKKQIQDFMRYIPGKNRNPSPTHLLEANKTCLAEIKNKNKLGLVQEKPLSLKNMSYKYLISEANANRKKLIFRPLDNGENDLHLYPLHDDCDYVYWAGIHKQIVVTAVSSIEAEKIASLEEARRYTAAAEAMAYQIINPIKPPPDFNYDSDAPSDHASSSSVYSARTYSNASSLSEADYIRSRASSAASSPVSPAAESKVARLLRSYAPEAPTYRQEEIFYVPPTAIAPGPVISIETQQLLQELGKRLQNACFSDKWSCYKCDSHSPFKMHHCRLCGQTICKTHLHTGPAPKLKQLGIKPIPHPNQNNINDYLCCDCGQILNKLNRNLGGFTTFADTLFTKEIIPTHRHLHHLLYKQQDRCNLWL